VGNAVRTRPTFLADGGFGGIYGLSFAEATQTSTAIGGAQVRLWHLADINPPMLSMSALGGEADIPNPRLDVR
jgi:hypothetical protein